MDCETLLTYLSDFIDNELDGDLTSEAEEHLATCSNCKVVLNSTQQMILLYRTQGKQQIPAVRREKLFSQIKAAFNKRAKNP